MSTYNHENMRRVQWEAALALDYVAAHIRAHGYTTPDSKHPVSCGWAGEPGCAPHILAHVRAALIAAYMRDDFPQAPIHQQAVTRAALTVAEVELEQIPHMELAGTAMAQQRLLALAYQLRSETGAYPDHVATSHRFASMLASEQPARAVLDSITCWRCAKTSFHPQDIAHRYCGACQLLESGIPR